MNFLQLCQRVARECGVSGTGPATVVSQTGEAGRVVNWTASAWNDVQLARPDWYWMRGTFSFTTTPSDRTYSSTDAGIASRFSTWDMDSMRCYQTSQNDEMSLSWMDYETFRNSYIIGAQTVSRPIVASIDPQQNLLLGPTPNLAYTISGEYVKAPQDLALDADTPEMPAQYRLAIVYRAMMMYARFTSAPEIYDDALQNYKRYLRLLEIHQLPTVELAGALV